MSLNNPTFLTFVVYLVSIVCIGLIAFQRTQNISDYLLGGRKLGPVVTALSVGASDMSGWLLLGLPGAIYVNGFGEVWLAAGLVIGAYINWKVVARPLRVFTVHVGDSLTLPDYLERRFCDETRMLRLLASVVTLVFFIFYTASGLVGGAILFENSFGVSYEMALLVGGFIIVSYTFVGGFLAVSWTDAIQALLMAGALIAVPSMVLFADANGADSGVIFGRIDSLLEVGFIGVLSLLAWGLGYPGQPHVLARFMAIEDPKKLVAARRFGMSWMLVVLTGSILTGLMGVSYFVDEPLQNPETVFISLSTSLFNPWVAGIITAAILSAIMSTVDSQLLVASSVISQDFYRVFFRPEASERELLGISRMAVGFIAILAIWIASNKDSKVLDLVSYAWAGFGASFGPVILFSLFSRAMTSSAALWGMGTGAFFVLVWGRLTGGIFDLYELLPAFFLACATIKLHVSLWPQQSQNVLEKFDAAWVVLKR
jgi:sodium/proline symporter